MRICEINNPVDTNVGEGGGGRDTPGSRARKNIHCEFGETWAAVALNF